MAILVCGGAGYIGSHAELDDHSSGHCCLRIRERYLPHRGATTAVVRAVRPVARFMTWGMMWGLRRRAQA